MKKEFTVYRSRWLRGLGAKLSGLAKLSKTSETGYRYCCLGFLAMQLMDMDTHEITDITSITELTMCNSEAVFKACPIRLMDNSEDRIMAVNDERTLTEKEREEELTRLFAGQQITIHFKD